MLHVVINQTHELFPSCLDRMLEDRQHSQVWFVGSCIVLRYALPMATPELQAALYESNVESFSFFKFTA